MGEKAIVFYCHGCGAMFFAAMARPQVFKDSADEIAEYLQAGDRMEVIDADEVRVQFESCKCNNDREEEE